MDLAHRLPARSLRAAVRRVAVAAVIGTMAALAFAPTGAGAQSSSTASVISTAKDSKLGTVLVAGDTVVYTLKPSKVDCTGKCLTSRPPVLLPTGMTSATAGTGVDASKLGTTTTTDGALQVTYAGKPLYWFAKDTSAGNAKGNVTDKYGKWAAVVTQAAKGGTGGSGDKNAGSGGVSF